MVMRRRGQESRLQLIIEDVFHVIVVVLRRRVRHDDGELAMLVCEACLE